MGLKVEVSDVVRLDQSTWKGELQPETVARLSPSRPPTQAEVSILLVSSPTYAEKTLKFEMNDVTVLNLGTSTSAYFHSFENRKVDEDQAFNKADSKQVIVAGAGDAIFLAALNQMTPVTRQAGTTLLKKIRERFPGYLTEHKNRVFVNRPKNFWAIQLQTRKDALKITLKGRPDQLVSSRLDVRLDRPPSYSAFTIRHPNETDDALTLITAASKL